MLTANLTGNLGNHMWNYVICRLVAEQLGYEWGVNPTPSHDYLHGQSQMYFMNIDYGKEVKIIGQNSMGLAMFEGIPNEYYDELKVHNTPTDSCCINMYDPNVFNIQDNTMVHIKSQSEDYLIDRREDVLQWFSFKDEYVDKYKQMLIERGLILDDNLCVINFRGGEWNSVPNLIASPKYWRDCMNHMLSINPQMKFIIITDDTATAQRYIPEVPCFHVEIGFDFYVVRNSKYLILANSSFSWWGGWLNQSANLILGPKYWGRSNLSNGYWSLGDLYSRFFKYMDRDGNISDFETCKSEALEFYKNNGLI